MSIVLDASVALAWVYAGETTNAILQLFEEVKAAGAWIPALWRWEIANVLQTNVRRGRHDANFRDAALANLAWFPIEVDVQCEPEAWLGTLLLADRHGLTVYDAAYLEIAKRKKIALATLDRDLRQAAESEGIELLGV